MNQERFSSIVETAVVHTRIAQLIVALPAALINILHLFVLFHKSMRTSSTNSILIGIALSDLAVLAVVFFDRVRQFWFSTIQCVEISVPILWIHDLQRDILEQTSFWLGVSLALTRLLIMKLPKRNGFVSDSKFGYGIVSIQLSISISISALFYFLVHNNAFREVPGQECPEAPDELFETLNRLELVSGGSQILICLIYPILAVLLISVIRASTNEEIQSKKSTTERHRSAKMILIMTILYVICSAPCGIMDFLQLFMHENQTLDVLATYGSTFIALFFCLNSMSHCLLSFAMSSKYRETAKKIFSWRSVKVRDSVTIVMPPGDQKY